MEKINVRFGGMTMTPDDSASRDGDMAVLLNAELKNGEVLPVNEGRSEGTNYIGRIRKAKWHGDRLLELRDNGDLGVLNKGDTDHEWPFSNYIVTDFEVVGNVVVLKATRKNTENEEMYYAIWKNNCYELLGALPEVPAMGITKVRSSAMEYTSWVLDDVNDLTEKASEYIGFFDKCIDKLYKLGRFIDNAMFIVGLKMFDGSYRYSHIYLIRDDYYDQSIGKYFLHRNFNIGHKRIPSDGKTHKLNFYVYGFDVGFKFDCDLSKWEDIITSIDVFSSGSIMEHKVSQFMYGSYNVYATKSIPELREEIESCSTFYKVAEYSLRGELRWKIDNTSPTNLANQDVLPLDNVKRVIPGHMYSYNNRLHINNYYNLTDIANDDVFGIYGAEGEFVQGDFNSYLEFENGGKKTYQAKRMYAGNATPYMISHPTKGIIRQEIVTDYNYNKKINVSLKTHSALDMSFVLYSANSSYDYKVTSSIFGAEVGMNGCMVLFDGTIFYSQAMNAGIGGYEEYRILFTPNETVNDGTRPGKIYIEYGAIYSRSQITVDYNESNLSKWGVYKYGSDSQDYTNLGLTVEIMINVTKGETYYSIDQIPWINGGLPDSIDNSVSHDVERNSLNVSLLDNPFYFPATQTYMFDGEIVEMASNAEAVSPGQFGQFPLYVFTTQGIYLMQVDSTGKTAYFSSAPVSREICNGSVCAFSGGVAFTTDKGVMAISGGEVTELSGALDGLPDEMISISASLLGDILKKANKSLTLDSFEKRPIRECIRGMKLAYDYRTNCLILFNPSYSGVYVYSLKSQTWSQCDAKYYLKTENLGPTGELVMYSDIYRINFGEGDNKRYLVAITRPVKVDTLDFKRLRQAALRCTFTGSLNFYVLGSNDGASFVCVTGKEYPSLNGNEPTNVTRRDLITSMSRSKQYKYIAIAVAGNMRGRISLAEMLVEGGFASNQLR